MITTRQTDVDGTLQPDTAAFHQAKEAAHTKIHTKVMSKAHCYLDCCIFKLVTKENMKLS